MSKTLYDNPLSGHAHRPRALLKLLEVPYETVVVDLAGGDHKRDGFLELNPLGQVPVFTDDDIVLRESTAILVYLAKAYDQSGHWLPVDPALAAAVQSWLAISTKELYFGPCAARISKLFAAPFDHGQAVASAHTLFESLFEPHLSQREWLVGDGPTIADIANYSYIAAAHEGEIDIGAYPHLQAWVRRVEGLNRFEKMPAAADILGRS